MLLMGNHSSGFLKYFGSGKSETELNLGLRIELDPIFTTLKLHTFLLLPRLCSYLFRTIFDLSEPLKIKEFKGLFHNLPVLLLLNIITLSQTTNATTY